MNATIKSVKMHKLENVGQIGEISYQFWKEYRFYKDMLQKEKITPDREKVLYLYKRISECEKEVSLEYNMSHDVKRSEKDTKILKSYRDDIRITKGYIADILILEL